MKSMALSLSLSLYLSLSPPHPHQWWDRVCTGDEAIDTTCCSIGADTSQLPLQARERAEKESHRFHSLSESDRSAEISNLTRVKKVLTFFIHEISHAPHIIISVSSPPNNLKYMYMYLCFKYTSVVIMCLFYIVFLTFLFDTSPYTSSI